MTNESERERLTRLEEKVYQQCESLARRLKALETILFGLVATVLTAVLVAVLNLVLRGGGPQP